MNKIKYLFIVLCLFLLVGCNNKEEKEKIEKKDKDEEITGDYNIDEEFDFMDFKIKVSDIVSFETIDKELSSDHNISVMKIPISIKNIGEGKNHLSMFYYKLYNPKEEEVLSKGQYFEDSLDYSEDLNPNEEYIKYIYIPYSVDGKYIIEFNNFSKKIKILINCNKK